MTTILVVPLHQHPPEVQIKIAHAMRDCLNITNPYLASYVDVTHSMREAKLTIETEFFGRGSLRKRSTLTLSMV